jgi:ribonuclease P protein component
MSPFKTITASEQIACLLRSGRRLRSDCVTIFVKARSEQSDVSGRVAFIAGKRLGNAVLRNRCKRVLRAAWQAQESEGASFFANNDILLVANKRTAKRGTPAVAQALRELLGQAAKDKGSYVQA